MVIYPNSMQGGEGSSSGGMRHLAVPGLRCGNAARRPSPAPMASRPPIQQGKKRDNSYSGPARVMTLPNQSRLITQNTNIPSNTRSDRTIPLSGLYGGDNNPQKLSPSTAAEVPCPLAPMQGRVLASPQGCWWKED